MCQLKFFRGMVVRKNEMYFRRILQWCHQHVHRQENEMAEIVKEEQVRSMTLWARLRKKKKTSVEFKYVNGPLRQKV